MATPSTDIAAVVGQRMPNVALAVAMPLALAAAYANILAAGRPFQISRAPIAMALFAIAMIILGTGSYYATQFLFPEYYAPIEDALLLTALGLAASAAGIALVRVMSQGKTPLQRWEWHPVKLDVAIYTLLIICLIGTLAAIHRIGYIPILRGDIREERLAYADQLGFLYMMSVMGVPAMILAGARRFAFGPSAGGNIAIVLGALCAGLYGPRFFPVLGAATLFLIYDQLRRRIRLWKVALVVCVVIPGLIGLAVYRESDLPAEAPLVTLSYLSFGEFRDFAWSLRYYEDPAHRVRGETLAGAVVPLLPGKVWSLVGVDKASLYDRSSAQLMSELMKVEVGIRIGIIGELYMNYGIAGVLVGMFLFGLLLAAIDARLRSSTVVSSIAPFFALISVLCVFALVGQLNMFGSSISVFGYPLLGAFLLASTARERSALATPRPASAL